MSLTPFSPLHQQGGPLAALAALAGGGHDPLTAGDQPDPTLGGGPTGAPGGGSEDQPISILRQMIDLAKQYIDVEPDEQDKATMTQIYAKLQSYLAKDQSDRETALGNGSIARLVRKAP